MSNDVKKDVDLEDKKLPSFGGVMFVIIYLVAAMGVSVLWLGIPIHVTLISASLVATIVAMRSGYTWDEIEDAILHGCSIAMAPMLILMIIGAIIGSWIASGTIQTIIYYGLQIMSPGWFLVSAALITAITSVATGSAWTTGGTLGVALIGIGKGLGIPLPIVAGAIVSGSFFGDKMSPLSDSTNLAAAVAEADLFDHIKHMIYTVGPSLLISLIIYFIIGLRFGEGTVNTAQIDQTLATLSNNFQIGPMLLIPPALVIVMAIKKVPAIPSLIIAAFTGAIFAMIFQGASLADVTNAMNYGYTSDTGFKFVDELLTRGGIQNMMWTVSLGFIALSFGGIMEKTHMLEVVLNKIEPLIKNTGGLIATTVATSYITDFAMASQYMAIIIPGRMLMPAYKRLKLLPRNLSRALEDGGTLVAPLVPWGLSGAFMTGALGVPTVEYIPFAFLCYITPIVSIIYGFTGFSMLYEGDVEGDPGYADREEEMTA
ncbi:MAG TPA: Na+/H+ antiporter NhaC [Halanaerobiales bacterium]|nr:Na+/H+ antiporter NhaC [Halanaerobiales bacterium]